MEFQHFRRLLVSSDSQALDWAVNESSSSKLNEQCSEYHILRQVILLEVRKIQDIEKVIQRLRIYPATDIFDYLEQFKAPDRTLSHLNKVSFSVKRVEAIRSWVPPFSSERVNPTSKNFKLTSQGNIVEDRVRKFLVKEANVFDHLENRRNLSILSSKSQILKDFVKKSSLESNLNTVDRESPVDIDLETLANFLEFQGVKFLDNDLSLIFENMGSSGTSLPLSQFRNFLESPIWNNSVY